MRRLPILPLIAAAIFANLSCTGDDGSAGGSSPDAASGDAPSDTPQSDGDGKDGAPDATLDASVDGNGDTGPDSDAGFPDASDDGGQDDGGQDATQDGPPADATVTCVPSVAWDHAVVQISGRRELVWDHGHAVEPNNLSDARLTPYRSAGGTTHLMLTHFENYRVSGASLESLEPTPHATFRSSEYFSVLQQDYGYHQWIMSPYTEDGIEMYALAHSEWYGCLAYPNDPVRGCNVGANQITSWVNAITLFHSADGGASWQQQGAGPQHVVLGPPAPYPDWSYWNSLAPLNYGMFHPSNIVKEGGHYYAIVRYTHRNSTSAVDAGGLALMRTDDIAAAGSWRTWVSGSTFDVPVEPLAVLPGTASFDHAGITYNQALCRYLIVFFDYADSKVYFTSTPTLASPQLEVPRLLAGQEYHLTSPSSIRPGFVPGNYANLLDPTWQGFNFEGSGTSPYLYYSTFDPSAPLTRDVFRVAMQVHDGPYVPWPLPEGLFMVGSGIYWANASGAYCVFPDWATFVALTGHSDTTGIPQYDSIPSSMVDQGVCQS